MMAPFPNYTDPDYYAAMVAAEVLGGNMASRLFVEVREKRGLVYGIQAGLAGNKHIGSLRIYAGTTPEQTHECLEVTLNELRKLEHEGITNDELERAKLQLKSENVMRSEGSGARMNSILRSWWYERKLRTVQETKDAIDAVRQEQVLNVMQRYSPLNPLTVAAIGPHCANSGRGNRANWTGQNGIGELDNPCRRWYLPRRVGPNEANCNTKKALILQ